LWTLDGLDAIEPSTVVRALDDSSRDVRVSALQISERWLAQPNEAVQQAVLKRATDTDWAVRRQLAATLGAFPANSTGESALVTMLDRFGDDPLVVDAAISGLRGREWTVLQRLLTDQTESPQRSAAITTLAATIVKGGQDSAAQALLTAISEASRTAWQRQALMSGVEVVLAGRSLPGAAPGRGNANAAAANSTAQGARGGPGGARAFPDDTNARGAGAAPAGAGRGGGGSGRGRGGGGGSLALTSEPAAFAALARGTSDLSPRASTVLARMTWPGKPAEPGTTPVAPLTPEQQKLYDTGQTLFNSLCMACHGDDGKGRTGLGPSLVGSQFALAPPVVPIRILLQGKEGTVGLMPPLGATLTDDQIAGALTYVRRQWGNAAGPVDPNTVQEVRTATTARTRPWTNDELTALGAGRGGQAPR
jgi:mono/diheme cytochrome c family protein